jgi:uncharacterized protein YjbI with pentapeptide repeats
MPRLLTDFDITVDDMFNLGAYSSDTIVTVTWKHVRVYGDTLVHSLHGNSWDRSEFKSCEINAVHCEGSYFNGTKFIDTRISDSHFDKTKWTGARWSGVVLNNSDFSGTDTTGENTQPYPGRTNFDSTLTVGVIASGTSFWGASWTGATRYITGASTGHGAWMSTACDYGGCNFTNANITRNVFLCCRMGTITWTGAICTDANFTGCSGMPDKATFKAAVSAWDGVIWTDGQPI